MRVKSMGSRWPALERAVDSAVEDIAAIDVTGPGKDLTTQVRKSLQGPDSKNSLKTVRLLLTALQQMVPILQEIDRLGGLEVQAEASAHPFGEAALEQLKYTLSTTDGDVKWLRQWLDAWSDALAEQQWDYCRKVAALTSPDGIGALRDELITITNCLEVLPQDGSDGRASQALPGLAEILGRDALPAVTATRLWVLRARIHRRFLQDPHTAVECARSAVSSSMGADRAIRVLAQSELAAACIDADLLTEARALTVAAFAVEAGLPDLLIVAGRMAAADGLFRQSEDLYDAAALRFSAKAVEPSLLRDIPANLLWRVARRICDTDPDAALRMLDQALATGIEGKGPYADRKVCVDKAELLESMGLIDEAAHSYADAAWRYSALGSNRALRLYEKAHALTPEVAEYSWYLAEELRFRAVAPYGEPDGEMLDRASELIHHSFESRRPGADDAWAFITAGLIDWSLTGDVDATVLVERALLVDPSSGRALGHLAWLLRRQGYLLEALAASSAGLDITRSDAFLVNEHVRALAELGRYREALEFLDDRSFRWPEDTDLALSKVTVNLWLNRPAEALEATSVDALDSTMRHFFSGVCFGLLGDRVGEMEALEQVCMARSSVPPDLVAWAALGLQHWDEAITRFDALATLRLGTAMPPEFSRDFGLGLAHLLRGQPDDLATGAANLRRAIRDTTDVGALIDLLQVDIPLARIAIAGSSLDSPALGILKEVAEIGTDRVEEIRMMVRPAGARSARLAKAREAITATRPRATRLRRQGQHYTETRSTAEGRLMEALGTYRDLNKSGDLPEVINAMLIALTELMVIGDDRFMAGDALEARRIWQSSAEFSAGLIGGGHLHGAIDVRIGLSELALTGPSQDVEKRFIDSDSESLGGAVKLFCRDVKSLWYLRDTLYEIARSDRVNDVQREMLIDSANRAPLQAVYKLERGAVSPGAVYPFPKAIGISLGAAHHDLLTGTELTAGIRRLRQGLTAQAGVKVPDVYVDVDAEVEGSPSTAELIWLDVFESPVAKLSFAPSDPERIDRVLGRFEEVLRDNLFRWLSLDDLELWSMGWSLAAPDSASAAPAPPLPTDPAKRLRLCQILRMLLREGVSIADRSTILAAFFDAEESGAVTPGTALRAVRSRLYPAILGHSSPDSIRPVPAQLEAALAKGLRKDLESGWALSRSSTVSLIRDLRTWCRAALPAGTAVISVTDELLRPHVWRLLSSEAPRIFVVAKAEIR